MRALVTGVTGQDGSYLAEQLTADGWQVWGLVRGQNNPRRDWITSLVPEIRLVDGDLLDPGSLIAAVQESEPDVVYNLAAITAPGMSWGQPTLTAEVTGLGALRMLEAVRMVHPSARVVQAGSVAVHGPYGAAKTFAAQVAADYRTGHRMHVTVVRPVGHHSPRRGTEFLSRKVTRAAARIASGQQRQLTLGWLGRSQDWGWADDFTTGIRAAADADPGDYTLGVGEPHTCQDWVEAAFAAAGLDWRQHVTATDISTQLVDVPDLTAPPDPRLPWTPRTDFTGLVASMVAADLALETP